MMGVNPLLDTLLVQTTAKGVGATPADKRPLMVPPVQPGDAMRELSSDSRLSDSAAKQAKGVAAYQANRLATVTPSTITTLNEAARTIADVLMKFPPGLVPALRLLPLPFAKLSAPGVLAQHLRNQVVSSGLFYESHVLKWSKGEFSLDQLAREPQFKGHGIVEGEESSYSQPLGQRLASAQERQQYMIRHQLELLGNASLRVEGDLSPGYPMTILFQRSYEGFIRSPEETVGEDGERPIIWRCLLRLEHALFSYIDYDLQLCGEELHLRMIGSSALMQEYFRRDEMKFREWFAAHGITKVKFYRKLVSRLEEKQPLKLPLLNTPNAYTKRAQTPFEHEYGQQAEHIISHAAHKGVPINMGPELMGLLMQLDFDQAIPEAMFGVCADIAAWTTEQVSYL